MPPKIKIRLAKEYSGAQINKLTESGARFIIYQYCISLFFAITLRRFSPAFLILPGEPANKYKGRYNLISLLFGWWGIPWGPVYTFRSVMLNNKGGIDYTDDILLNLTEEGLLAGEIEILQTEQIFCKPGKMDIRAFKKALLPVFERDLNMVKLIAAVFINTEDGYEPYFTLGILAKKDFETVCDLSRKALLKQFYKDTPFEFVDLSTGDKVCCLLEKQGEPIINRQVGS
jgi:hypothetical protein